jgi:hypothetical protein
MLTERAAHFGGKGRPVEVYQQLLGRKVQRRRADNV